MEKATKVAASQTGNEPPLKTPHGLDEIIASFGDIREYVEADGQLEARSASGFPGASEFAVFAPFVVGPVANYHPDDMPPSSDSGLLIRLRQYSRRPAAR